MSSSSSIFGLPLDSKPNGIPPQKFALLRFVSRLNTQGTSQHPISFASLFPLCRQLDSCSQDHLSGLALFQQELLLHVESGVLFQGTIYSDIIIVMKKYNKQWHCKGLFGLVPL